MLTVGNITNSNSSISTYFQYSLKHDLVLFRYNKKKAEIEANKDKQEILSEFHELQQTIANRIDDIKFWIIHMYENSIEKLYCFFKETRLHDISKEIQQQLIDMESKIDSKISTHTQIENNEKSPLTNTNASIYGFNL